MTQFQRAMQDLEIELISAHSPEARGRIERLFGTLQDRLANASFQHQYARGSEYIFKTIATNYYNTQTQLETAS